MLKKLATIGLAASIGFAPVVLAPITAMARSDAPAASAPAAPSSDASAKPAKAKKTKTVKKAKAKDDSPPVAKTPTR
jgi:hypothetical protein